MVPECISHRLVLNIDHLPWSLVGMREKYLVVGADKCVSKIY